MFLSIILAVIVALVTVTAYDVLRGESREPFVREETIIDGEVVEIQSRRRKLTADPANWGKAILLGMIVGAINYFAPRLGHGTLWLAPICLVAMLGVYVYLMHWWHREGSEWTEMIPFAILAILVFFPAKAAAAATTVLWNSVFWTSIVNLLPALVLVATLGYFVINFFYFRYNEVDEGDEEQQRHHRWGIVAIAVTTIILLIILFTGAKWSHHDGTAASRVAGPVAQAVEPVDTVPSSPATSWHFYNQDLAEDGDDSNDFNFGPSPLAEDKTAEDYDRELRERLRNDPVLGSGVIAWLDANLGTRYLGEFYESCKGDWAKIINQAKEAWLNDPEAYNETLDAVFKFMDTAKVSVGERSDLDDQLYMNPYTVDGVPDIIVMKTLNHEGTFLVYSFEIKGVTTTEGADGSPKEIAVTYRIDCGFQPTNVEKVMGITPQSTPKPASTPKPTPAPSPSPSPAPTPTPSTPVYNKDKTKGTHEYTESNDDPGLGPDTNNGVGAQESTEDQPTNSTKYSEDEYKEWAEDMAETNQDQKTGGDPNTPSTTPAPGTNVDNNADNGTGHGGIDTPTPVTPPAVEAVTGQEITDSPGGIWGGPQD